MNAFVELTRDIYVVDLVGAAMEYQTAIPPQTTLSNFYLIEVEGLIPSSQFTDTNSLPEIFDISGVSDPSCVKIIKNYDGETKKSKSELSATLEKIHQNTLPGAIPMDTSDLFNDKYTRHVQRLICPAECLHQIKINRGTVIHSHHIAVSNAHMHPNAIPQSHRADIGPFQFDIAGPESWSEFLEPYRLLQTYDGKKTPFAHAKQMSSGFGSPNVSIYQAYGYENQRKSVSCHESTGVLESWGRNMPLSHMGIDPQSLDTQSNTVVATTYDGFWFVVSAPHDSNQCAILDAEDFEFSAGLDPFVPQHIQDVITPLADQTLKNQFIDDGRFYALYPGRVVPVEKQNVSGQTTIFPQWMKYDETIPYMFWDLKSRSGHKALTSDEGIAFSWDSLSRFYPQDKSEPKIDQDRGHRTFVTTGTNQSSLSPLFGGFDGVVRGDPEMREACQQLGIEYDRADHGPQRVKLLFSPHHSAKPGGASFQQYDQFELATQQHGFQNAQPYFNRWLDLSNQEFQALSLRKINDPNNISPCGIRVYGQGFDRRGNLICTFRMEG